jgi:two-component system sensor histidine kinase DegS
MAQAPQSAASHRRLLALKWLMVAIPPLTVAVGHGLATIGHDLPNHAPGGLAATSLVTAAATGLTFALSYGFVATLFGVLRRLRAEAAASERDVLTLNAVMRERERLSRELHDGAAQLVAQVLLRLDTIKALVEADRPREAAAELERLRGVADELYDDIGESIDGLRSNVRERGLVAALRDYLEQFEERHGIATRLHAAAAAELLPPLPAIQIFRLVQEALTNVRKHAGAREATVTLAPDGPGRLAVVVADDGRGFDPDGQQRAGRTLGLTSMRERVEGLGGTLRVHSQPGSGTRVLATVPSRPVGKEDERAALATPAGR